MISVAILSYIKVFVNPTQHRMELFNEVIFMNLLYCIMCFSDFLQDVEVQLTIGYIACGLVALHFIINLFLILHTTVRSLIRKVRLRNFSKSH